MRITDTNANDPAGTKFILRIHMPDTPSRRIPLNHRTLRLGHEGSGADVGLLLPLGVAWGARLTFSDDRFTLRHEGGTVTPLVNNMTVVSATLNDGDIITVGPVTLRYFRLLEPPAELVVVGGEGAGERFVLDTSVVRLGRSGKRDNDIVLQDPTVSREHATIFHRNGRFWLTPETSASPTMVGGVLVTQPRALLDNDRVNLGEQALLFHAECA